MCNVFSVCVCGCVAVIQVPGTAPVIAPSGLTGGGGKVGDLTLRWQVTADFFLLFILFILVTEYICILSLCYCTLYVTHSVTVTGFFFFCVWMSFNWIIIWHIFYVLLFWTSQKDMQRTWEAAPTASHTYHQEIKLKLKNLWLCLVTSNLLVSSFHQPFTSGAGEQACK